MEAGEDLGKAKASAYASWLGYVGPTLSVTTDVFAFALANLSQIKGFSQENFETALTQLKEFEDDRAGSEE